MVSAYPAEIEYRDRLRPNLASRVAGLFASVERLRSFDDAVLGTHFIGAFARARWCRIH